MFPQKLAEKYRALIRERMPKIETAHDETGHYYVLNGQKYPSVTAQLQMLKDEGLMNWKMNRALKHIENEIFKIQTDGRNQMNSVSIEYLRILIEQARLVPIKEFEGAGDIGRQVHEWREKWFKELIEGKTELISASHIGTTDPAVTSATRAIRKFVTETNYIPVACELFLADPVLGIGGTLDDIGILPGAYKEPYSDPVLGGGYKLRYNPKLVLIDLKTSNIGNKTSYYLQVALYYYMFKKLTGISIKEFYILHVSKTDGTYKLIPIKNMTQLIRDAKTLLKLKKSLDRIDGEKKKEPIVV